MEETVQKLIATKHTNLQYLAEKFDVSIQDVKNTINKVGNNRDDVERELNNGRNTN